jgi:hypothetical protein
VYHEHYGRSTGAGNSVPDADPSTGIGNVSGAKEGNGARLGAASGVDTGVGVVACAAGEYSSAVNCDEVRKSKLHPPPLQYP